MPRDSKQHVVRFSNGLECSVISDGYGSEAAPYEVLLRTTNDSVLSEATKVALGFQSDGMVGWLTSEQLGELLLKVGGAVVTVVTAYER
jgi:hypothetical protein